PGLGWPCVSGPSGLGSEIDPDGEPDVIRIRVSPSQLAVPEAQRETHAGRSRFRRTQSESRPGPRCGSPARHGSEGPRLRLLVFGTPRLDSRAPRPASPPLPDVERLLGRAACRVELRQARGLAERV